MNNSYNKFQQAIQSFRDFIAPPVSPLPSTNTENLSNAIVGVGEDFKRGAQGAFNLVPPVQAAKRGITTKQYQDYNIAVPYEEQRIQQAEDYNSGKNALKAAGYLNVPFVAGGAVTGGLLSTVRELLKDKNISRDDAIGIIADSIEGARGAAQYGTATLGFNLLKPFLARQKLILGNKVIRPLEFLDKKPLPKQKIKGPFVPSGTADKPIRNTRMIPKDSGSWKIDERFGSNNKDYIKYNKKP